MVGFLKAFPLFLGWVNAMSEDAGEFATFKYFGCFAVI